MKQIVILALGILLILTPSLVPAKGEIFFNPPFHIKERSGGNSYITSIKNDDSGDGRILFSYKSTTGFVGIVYADDILNKDELVLRIREARAAKKNEPLALNNKSLGYENTAIKEKPKTPSAPPSFFDGWNGQKVKIKKGTLLCDFLIMETALILEKVGETKSLEALITQNRCTKAPYDFMAVVVKDASTFTDPYLAEIMVNGVSFWGAMDAMDCCYK